MAAVTHVDDERTKKALDYFRKEIRKLEDDLLCPADEPREEFLVDCIMKLRGALWYAFKIGDIDKCRYRIYTDELNSLYSIAVNYDGKKLLSYRQQERGQEHVSKV